MAHPRISVRGPFGEVVKKTGLASGQPFRFSTKHQDGETGLLYYGRRYYQPTTGRWLCRDRMQEIGGKNLYAFVLNNPISRKDYLGMCCTVGHVRNPVALGAITPGGINPESLASVNSLEADYGSWEIFNNVMDAVQVSVASAQGLGVAINQASELILGHSVPSAMAQLIQGYVGAFNQGLTMLGYGINVRIKYQKCESLLFFWTHWVDIDDDPWVLVDAPYDPTAPFNTGLYQTSTSAFAALGTAKSTQITSWQTANALILDQ